jgi:NAD(P)-dependent dehydrogenase (short-subunit alcohol dehydrogenase family)
VLRSAGRIDVVVNNAASGTAGLLEAFSLDEVRKSFETVAFGALRVDKAVLPAMRRQQSGLLIHVSSTGGRVIVPFVSPYSAAKAALEAFAEEFAFELTPFGIDSVIVEPGGFLTEGLANGSGIAFAADQEIPKQYGELATKPQEMFDGFGAAFSGPEAPDPQQVADAIADLIDLPAGQRPLRTVVGTLVTAGVRELNERYDKSRHELLSSLGMV